MGREEGIVEHAFYRVGSRLEPGRIFVVIGGELGGDWRRGGVGWGRVGFLGVCIELLNPLGSNIFGNSQHGDHFQAFSDLAQ